MAARFVAELALTSRELARLRGDVTRADVHTLSQGHAVREGAAAIRATTYVWLASVLERVVRDALRATLREISGKLVPAQNLKASLFALICEREFDSIATASRSRSWLTKISLFARLMETGPALLSEDILPLDGRTIRGEHFDAIWQVLGLAGQSLPTPRHRVGLRDLADGRNEVAHGHTDPVSFGRTKATSDVLRLVSLVDDTIAHMLGELDSYLEKERFRR